MGDVSFTSKVNDNQIDVGVERSIEITLNGTPGTLTTVTLPTDVKGIKLYPRTTPIRFAAYYGNSVRTLAAVSTDTSGTVIAANLAIGGVAKNDIWETRLLMPNLQATTRILTIRSTTASAVVDLEVF